MAEFGRQTEPTPGQSGEPVQFSVRQPRTRWRFSLKAAFVILTIPALAIGWVTREFHRLSRQDWLAAQVEARGGSVLREPVDLSNPFSAASWLEFFDRRFSRQVMSVHDVNPKAEDLRNLSSFPFLHSLRVTKSELDASAIESIASIRTLRTLRFAACRVDGKFTHFDRLPELRTLELQDCTLAKGTLAGLESSTLQVLSLPRSQFTLSDLSACAKLKLVQLDLSGTTMNDAALLLLEPLTFLTRLDLSETEVTNEGLSRLRAFKELASLKVSESRITDTAVVALQLELPNLDVVVGEARPDNAVRPNAVKLRETTALQFRGPFISDATLRWLNTAQELRHLYLNGTSITDAGLASLRTCTKLETLDIRDTSITAAGMDHLTQLPLLETLFAGSQLDDAALRKISSVTTLMRLGVSGPSISDDGIASLGNLPRLDYLALSAPAATGEGLEALTKLPELESVTLFQMPFTRAGASRLAELPALSMLDLGGGVVEAGALRELAKSPSLRVVSVGAMPQPLEDVLALADIPSLESVGLAEEAATFRSARLLAEKRPALKVWVYSPGKPALLVSPNGEP